MMHLSTPGRAKERVAGLTSCSAPTNETMLISLHEVNRHIKKTRKYDAYLLTVF